MAILYKQKNQLEYDCKKYKKRMILGLSIAGLSFLIGWFCGLRQVIGIVFLSSGFWGLYNKKKFETVQSGVIGETKTQNLAQKLPDNYSAISNATILYDGKSSELDLVVVGQNGIFVIETKNHNGHIVGDVSDSQWIQHKVGQKGGEYSKDLYSPVKQVGTHVYRLSNFLKQNGINVWVQGVVFFSNHEASLDINGSSETPVFCANEGGERELINYVGEYEGKSKIDSGTMERIVNLLK